MKSLAPFPRILRMLDANLEWTEQLGEAYLADPAASYGRRPAASPSGSIGWQAGHDAARDPTHGTGAHTYRRVHYDRGPESRGRVRPDLRSFIRLRSLALPRLSAVFPRLRGHNYRRVRLDRRPDRPATGVGLRLGMPETAVLDPSRVPPSGCRPTLGREILGLVEPEAQSEV